MDARLKVAELEQDSPLVALFAELRAEAVERAARERDEATLAPFDLN